MLKIAFAISSNHLIQYLILIFATSVALGEWKQDGKFEPNKPKQECMQKLP